MPTSQMTTCRERLFRSLSGEALYPAPAWLLFPYHPLGCYVDVQTHPAYRPVFEASKDRIIMLDRRSLHTPLHVPAVETRREEIRESGRRGSRIIMRYNDIELRHEVCYTDEGTVKHPFITSAEELEAFLSLPVETDPERLHAALDEQMPQYLRERGEFPEHYGAMMLCLHEPVTPLYGHCDLAEYAIASITHAEAIQSWLDTVMQRLRIIYRYCLERELAEVYFLVGSEMASPPLLRRETFQQWAVSYARELIALIHDAGAFAIQHYHGQIRDILPDFVTMGADALHTIEAPPVGDCTLHDAFAVTRDALTLIGNIQYDEFRSLTPSEMYRKVKDLQEQCRGQRYIVSPTAGPFDPDVPDRVIQNYLAFIEAACPA